MGVIQKITKDEYVARFCSQYSSEIRKIFGDQDSAKVWVYQHVMYEKCWFAKYMQRLKELRG
jgi:hypothetical protein